MAYDPADQYVVLFGGYNQSTTSVLNDTWTYSHGKWTNITTSHHPADRRGSAMAYDATDGYLVLFGGVEHFNICCFQDTWTFSAGQWTDVTPTLVNGTNTPAARFSPGIAYDVADHYLVMYGGCSTLSCSTSLNDTWKFTGGNWTPLNDHGRNPGDRGSEMMLWYPPANAIFMFGGTKPGFGTNGRHYNDSWQYSDGNWTRLATRDDPGARGSAWMVYDPAYQYIVLFGGLADGSSSGNGPISDTWLYLPKGWIDESPNLTVQPPARWGLENAGVWDATDGYPLLFSGRNPTGSDLPDSWTINWTLRATLVSSQAGIDRNQSIEVTANASGGTFSYNLTFGNLPAGCRATNSSSIPCTFNVTGTFPVSVTVTDSGGKRVVANLTIQVFPDPWATFSVAPAVVDLGQSVLYTVTVRGGSGGLNFTYSPLPPGCGQRDAATLSCTPTAAGSYTNWARVVDRAGMVAATAVVNITVHPRPTIFLQTGPTSGIAPLTVNFSAQVAGGTLPVTYAWRFGDGSPNVSGAIVTHVYLAFGTYIASVAATDSRGDLVANQVAINVLVRPLSVASTANRTIGEVPFTVGFGTTIIGGQGPYDFLWTFDDGTKSTSPDPAHTFRSAGPSRVAWTVSDAIGEQVRSSVTIEAIAPLSAAVAPVAATLTLGQSANFSVTTHGGKAPVSFTWSGLPLGCSSVNRSFLTCQPTNVSNSTVSVLATDSLGGRSSSSARLEVGPVPRSSTGPPGPARAFDSPLTWFSIAVVVSVAAGLVVALSRRRPPRSNSNAAQFETAEPPTAIDGSPAESS
jgi:PKD repeat protein